MVKKKSSPSTADLIWNDPLFQLRRAELENKQLREGNLSRARLELERSRLLSIPLDKAEKVILRILYDEDCLLSQYEIEAALKEKKYGPYSLDRKTISKYLKQLRGRGLVSRPGGPKGGEYITENGIEALRPGRKKI